SYLTHIATDGGGLAAAAAWIAVLDAALPAEIDEPLALDLDALASEISGLRGLATDLGAVTFTDRGGREPFGLGLVTERVPSGIRWSPLSRIPLVAPSPPGTAPHPATVETTTTVPTTVVPTTTS
ncbi:MAG: hypothetical protein HKN26_00840, partial [Acidimicrobiales bacterium]|nr:hypothetical protein [Acidimicrobiales bacterium]